MLSGHAYSEEVMPDMDAPEVDPLIESLRTINLYAIFKRKIGQPQFVMI